VLSHIFEAAGLVTVGISIVRGQAETARPPRMLHCEFPLGRPLGKPDDAEFQRRVLTAMLELTSRDDVPVLVDFPEVIEEEGDAPAACPLPPRIDSDLHPALDELNGLRGAYDRNVSAVGRTLLGRVAGPDELGGLIEQLIRIDEENATLADLGWDAMHAISVGQDLRAYYEEAGMQLATNTGARQLLTWFYESTQTGNLLRRVRDKLKETGEDQMASTYLIPGTQS